MYTVDNFLDQFFENQSFFCVVAAYGSFLKTQTSLGLFAFSGRQMSLKWRSAIYYKKVRK